MGARKEGNGLCEGRIVCDGDKVRSIVVKWRKSECVMGKRKKEMG